VMMLLALAVPLGLTAYGRAGQAGIYGVYAMVGAGPYLGEEAVQEVQEAAPVPLTVFLYDNCGGCGVGLQGCGACDEQDRLHLMIFRQFGNRLHDGGIVYRLFNTRLPMHDENRRELSEAFGMAEELRGVLPVAFIGDGEHGIYVVGEDMMAGLMEIFDEFVGE